MRTYLIRRLLLAIPTVFLVSFMVFLTIRLIPGSIVDLMLNQYQWVTNMDINVIKHNLGMDVPVYIQYFRWMGNILLHGDFGKSLWYNMPVLQTLLSKLPVTFELGFISLIIAQVIALPIGIFSALRQDTWGDYLARSFAILAIAIPSFWLATLVIVFPSIWWGWSPPLRLVPFMENPIKNLGEFIVPSFVLGLSMAGGTMRMMRTMMLEILRQDYIRTAWAKGLRERTVVIRHTLKNALIPVITTIGLGLPLLIGGAVIIEDIFGLPGLGRLMVEATTMRDYTIVSGDMFLFAFGLVIINLLVDLSYGLLDPRIQYK
jgi:peptide/nickel transport system permease protein